MDHGRSGPPGALGGGAGGANTVVGHAGRRDYVPPHLSKDQDIEIGAGDVIARLDAGRRRLRRSGAARARAGRARRRARLLQPRSRGARRSSARGHEVSCTRRACPGGCWSPCRALAGAGAEPSCRSPGQVVRGRVEDNAFTVEMPGIPDHRVHQRRFRSRHAFRAAFLQPRKRRLFLRRPDGALSAPTSTSASRAASCRRRSTAAPSSSPAASGIAPTGARSTAAPRSNRPARPGRHDAAPALAPEGAALRVARLPRAERRRPRGQPFLPVAEVEVMSQTAHPYPRSGRHHRHASRIRPAPCRWAWAPTTSSPPSRC